MSPRAGRPRATVPQLLDGGDWACSFGRRGSLTHVCEQLAVAIENPLLAEKAFDIAREAEHDLDVAARHWSELVQLIREYWLTRGIADSEMEERLLI